MTKFWVVYPLFLAIVFGAMAGGVYYIDTHVGLDILTNPGGFQIMGHVIVYQNGTGRIFSRDLSTTFHSNGQLGLEPGVCYLIELDASPFNGVSLDIIKSSQEFCH